MMSSRTLTVPTAAAAVADVVRVVVAADDAVADDDDDETCDQGGDETTCSDQGGCDKAEGVVPGDGADGEKLASISLRRATLKDAASLTSVINEAYDHHKILFTRAGTSRVAPDGTEVASLLQLPCSTFLVAEEANSDGSLEMVGCVQVTWSGTTDSKQPGVDAHFGTLSVRNKCAGRGIGKFLVSAAEECCRKELGRPKIVVEITVVSIMPDLFAWYKAQGYEMGIVIPFTMDNYVREECDVGLQLMTKTLYSDAEKPPPTSG